MLTHPERIKEELVAWIRGYFEQNGPTCSAVVGISGGKDSSVVAALCKEALGAERVVGVLMPNDVQSDIDDAKEVVAHLGIPYMIVNIGNAYRALTKAIVQGEGFSNVTGRTDLARDAEINTPPRLRMATLYAVGQNLPHGARVANTCNGSEDYVGYSTKFGDAAGDFSPLANLVVEEVRQIGCLLDIPRHLVDKTPSDGLSGQSDEDKLDLKSFDWQPFESTPSAGNSQSQDKTPWNAEKSAKLAEFMKTWGEKMGQPNYQKGIAGGDVGPDNLYTLGDNSKMDAIYTDTGQGNAKYRIVERYSNWDKYPDVHSYFFAITDTGEGIVFHSPTTNGGKMYLKPTDNKELQEEFTQLLHQ